MILIKKIFNKILFASVVAIVFALFNRCDVKALTITHYYKEGNNSANPQQVEFIDIPEENILPECRDKLYYFYSMGINSAGHYYVRGTCVPTNTSVSGIYNLYNNIYTVGNVLKNYNQYSYNIDMTTLQMTRPGTWNNDYQYWNPQIRSNTISSTNTYIASDFDLYYGSTNDTKINIEVPPSNPTITFSPNYVKVNNLYVAVNILVKVLNYNFTDYKYYYSFVSEEDSEDVDYDTLEYTELFEQNFLLLEDEADSTLHFDHNGYLFMKIVDISNDEVVYSTSLHISALSTKEPDIDININYNSGNSTTIDEILIDTDYNIYSSNLTGYKCYYLFSNTEIEPSTNDFTETDCSGGRLYVAHNNGYYYARITYNDEIVADVVRNISEYGQLISTIYSDYSNNIFNKLLGGTNGYLGIFTNNKGPLYSLVSLPLRLGTFIYNFFNSSNFCTPYDFGTIFGQHFTIGCINLSVLGSPLLQTIDTIFAGFFTITWGLFLYKLLRRMILLKDISITGLFKGGIF